MFYATLMHMKKILDQKRQSLANVDAGLLALLERRVELAREFATIKKELDLSTFLPGVEQQKIASLKEKTHDPFVKNAIEILWPVLFGVSKKLQDEVRAEHK